MQILGPNERGRGFIFPIKFAEMSHCAEKAAACKSGWLLALFQGRSGYATRPAAAIQGSANTEGQTCICASASKSFIFSNVYLSEHPNSFLRGILANRGFTRRDQSSSSEAVEVEVNNQKNEAPRSHLLRKYVIKPKLVFTYVLKGNDSTC